MQSEKVIYHHGQQALQGYYACQSEGKNLPGVLVFHDWAGRNEFAEKKAQWLASMGYLGFAVDMYGEGKTGHTIEEKQQLMTPLIKDRNLLMDRAKTALDTLISLDRVDTSKVAAIGFCFGGLCVLDLARSGANINGVVSLHGLLHAPESPPNAQIHTKILALHGYDDPMVKPDQVNQFCQEMTHAKADWQVHMYGMTQHAFTNPEAHDTKLGTVYDQIAEKRALQATQAFLSELFK